MLYRAADLGADGIVLNATKTGTEDLADSRTDDRVGCGTWISNGNRAHRAQAIRHKSSGEQASAN
jgi:hypothetical protein